MRTEIRKYTDSDWDQLKKFLSTYWSSTHPILNHELFSWQYRGYGPLKNEPQSRLLIVNGGIAGFRGVIPGIYQLISQKNRVELSGGSFAIWVVKPELRGKGLGYKMMTDIEGELNVTLSAGANINTSAPIYRRNAYSFSKNLNRYVIPLDIYNYHKLLSSQVSISALQNWSSQLSIPEPRIKPSNPNVNDLAELWQHSTLPVGLFSLSRDAEFWKWRYMESPGFQYLYFGDPKAVGVVVARVESVYCPDSSDIHGLKVLRIIEIIPRDYTAWEGAVPEDLITLLQEVLSWAKDQGCCAADFQVSTERLEKLMYYIGFKKQSFDYSPDICSLAGLFQPFKLKPAPINAFWKAKDDQGALYEIDSNDTYIVKSDNDMDRTNYWPVVDKPVNYS